MGYYEASAKIAAGPERVWEVLVDGSGWPQWDSGVDAVEGQIAPGEKITIRTEAAPGRAFPVKVTEFTPGRQLVLTGGMPLGLFEGVRSYTLTPSEDGGTRFHMREDYSGPLLGLIWRTVPDLSPWFTRFAAGLKHRAEQGVT